MSAGPRGGNFHGTIFSRHGFPKRRAGMRYGPPARRADMLLADSLPRCSALKMPENRTARPLSLRMAPLFPACPRPGRPGSGLAWNNLLSTWASWTPSGHTVRSSGTLSGHAVGGFRAPWTALKVPENRTVRPLSLLESMLFLARQRPGGRRVHYSHGTTFVPCALAFRPGAETAGARATPRQPMNVRQVSRSLTAR